MSKTYSRKIRVDELVKILLAFPEDAEVEILDEFIFVGDQQIYDDYRGVKSDIIMIGSPRKPDPVDESRWAHYHDPFGIFLGIPLLDPFFVPEARFFYDENGL